MKSALAALLCFGLIAVVFGGGRAILMAQMHLHSVHYAALQP
jgi:hypothetical protein